MSICSMGLVALMKMMSMLYITVVQGTCYLKLPTQLYCHLI